MRRRGESWRGFVIGGAALCTCGKRHRVYEGATYKPQEGTNGPRRCAEEEAKKAAEEAGCTEMVGIVTYGPYQADDFTGIDLGVTLPCVFCRHMFRESLSKSGIIKPWTRIIAYNMDTLACVELTVEALLNMCPDK